MGIREVTLNYEVLQHISEKSGITQQLYNRGG